MLPFEKKILTSILDSYEKSTVFTGENKVRVRIAFPFTKRTIPAYFEESSTQYEEIHSRVEQLEKEGFLEIVWKDGKVGHIISKVLLREEALPSIYAYMGRRPKRQNLETIEELIQAEEQAGLTPCLKNFLAKLKMRLDAGRSVKEYVDITQNEESKKLFKAIRVVEENKKECFPREFSQEHFGDTKYFSKLTAKLGKIFRENLPEFQDMETKDILAEYQIYPTPSFIYLKGNAVFRLGSSTVEGRDFTSGLGFSLSPEELEKLTIEAGENEVETIYTIENLTSFFRFPVNNSIVLYLGGYHNGARREFLKKLKDTFPKARFYHFGDIDAGGFYIYHHLKDRTGIPFTTFAMDKETLVQYSAHSKVLTANDRARLVKLLAKELSEEERIVINYMLEQDLKLEQECVQINLKEMDKSVKE